MNLQLTTIANYTTPEEAEIARQILAEYGISAVLEGASVLGTISIWGNATGWVKLQVPAADIERARQLLSEHLSTETADTPPRHCPRCGELSPAGFAVCWSCQSPLDDAEEAPTVENPAKISTDANDGEHGGEEDSDDRDATENADERDFARHPLADGGESAENTEQGRREDVGDDEQDESLPTDAGDALARRAFFAAMLSLFVCPPFLSFYSAWVLIKISLQERPMSRRGNRFYNAAMVVNLGVCVEVGLFINMFRF